jgi:hypothetical protein
MVLVVSAPALAGELTPLPAPPAGPASLMPLSVRDGRARRVVTAAEIETLPAYRFALPDDPTGLDGVYTGVRLVDLLEHLGLADVRRLSVRASDAYEVVLAPAEDEGFAQILFATRRDGVPISPETRGPYRLIWAANAEDVVAGTATYARWIWNIEEIRAVR